MSDEIRKIKVTVQADEIDDDGVDLDFDPIDDIDFFNTTDEQQSSKPNSPTSVHKRSDTAITTAAEDDDRSSGVTFRVTMGNDASQRRVSDDELSQLYHEMDIDQPTKSTTHRLNSILVHGVDNMSSFDVKRIFAEYHPEDVEWINDSKCNVVWPENIRAARAMIDLSKPLKRVRPVKDSAEDGEIDRSSDEEDGQLKPVDDDVVEVRSGTDTIMNEQEDDIVEESVVDEKPAKRMDDCVEVDVSKVTIPPGKWRVLTKHVDNATFLLIRFTTVTDVKGKNAHRFSKYYVEHGNPKFGGVKGLISGTRRRLLRDGQITGGNQEFTYKWTKRDKVRPGLNVFDSDNRELEWDYEHDTRFYDDPTAQGIETSSSTMTNEITDDVVLIGKPATKSRGRGTKRARTIDEILAGSTMRADDEYSRKLSSHRNTGRGMRSFDDDQEDEQENNDDDDDDAILLDDDRNPEPTPQPWDAPLLRDRLGKRTRRQN